MDCKTMGNLTISGNFAERTETKPKDLDYMQTAKYFEAYPFDWRETLGGTVCNCTRLKVNYAPYFGYDYFHLDTCNLMRKLEAEPGINNLIETYLPAVTRYTDSVPADTPVPVYIKGRRNSRSYIIKVIVRENRTLSLFNMATV